MISVIVPIYNVENYLKPCLESICKQTYQDFELLLVNDGTKDNSLKVIDEVLGKSDINYHVINKENGGLSSARNAGIKRAKGEYLAFVDSDDVISADFLSTLLSNIEKTDAQFAFCAYEFEKEQICPLDDNGKTVIFDRNQLMTAFLRRTIDFVVPSMMFRTAFILDNEIFFNEKIRFSEDQPFIWDAILASEKAVYLYKKMYGYYLRESSIMHATPADKIISSYREYALFVDKLKGQYPNDIKVLDLIIPRWSLGALYSSAALCDYRTFKTIYQEMDGQELLRKIKGIKDLKSYLLATVSFLSPKLLYELCNRMSH